MIILQLKANKEEDIQIVKIFFLFFLLTIFIYKYLLGLALTFKTTSRIKKTSQFERHIKTLRSNNYLSGTIQVSLKTIFPTKQI